MINTFPDRMFARARELQAQGVERMLASSVAWLEERINHWPLAWGDDFRVLIYGDLQVPNRALTYPTLGITIHPEKQENTVIRGALTVLAATVKVNEKSVPALIDAARRVNLLLGAHTLEDWGNSASGWWSWVTHGNSGGSLSTLTEVEIETIAQAVVALPTGVRAKVEAALFWVREPRNLLLESYRSDTFRIYSAYWNAFECLVEAVNLLRPREPLSKLGKQAQIDEFVQNRHGRLTASDVQECYLTIVNTGLVGKAAHALRVCFGAEGDAYITECFRLSPQQDRLYDVRNAINHGDIDAENVNEILRVEARLWRLWMIVWRMFAKLIPFSGPVDPTFSPSADNTSARAQ
jgi:hypothetical protein